VLGQRTLGAVTLTVEQRAKFVAVMEDGRMIRVIVVMLAVLIVIWAGGREARVDWARA
jgi:hypothetical protein